MKRLYFFFLLCLGLLFSPVELASKELPTSSEWQWQTAAVSAVAALSALFLGALYYFKGTPLVSVGETKTMVDAAQDFSDALSNKRLIKDSTLLFLIKEIKEKQLVESTTDLKENIKSCIQPLQEISETKLGVTLETVDYLIKLRDSLNSIRPQYEKQGDIVFNPKSYINPDRVKLYTSVQESFRYLGGYWGLMDDLNRMIGQESARLAEKLTISKTENEEKIKRLEDQMRKMKEQQGS